MAYYDISGKLEISSPSSQKEILGRLLASFRSSRVNAVIQEDNQVTFNIPFLRTVTRGYIFQGISSGLLRLEETNLNTFILEYRLVTLPMRLFLIIMVLWLGVGMPAVSSLFGEAINFQSYISFGSVAIVFVAFAFLVSRFFVKHKFTVFIQESLREMAKVIRQPVPRKHTDARRIIVFSCSGILFVVLLVPALIFFNIISIQSKVVWRYPIENTVMSAPVTSNGVVYFGSLNDITSASFYALDTESGKEIWAKPLNGGVWSSPVLTNHAVCFGTDDGFFRCLDQRNGEEQWNFGPEERKLDPASCDQCALKLNAPAINNGNIYVGSHDHSLYALNAKTGQLKWSFATNGSITDAPAIVNGTVYVGSLDGYVYALDAASGAEIRLYHVPNTATSEPNEALGVNATPLIDSNTIYAANGALTAIDIQTSEIKWQILGTSIYEDQIISRPLASDTLIMVATTDALYGINKLSGAIEWKYSNIKGNIFFSPILYEGFVYFGDSSGYLYKVSSKTGSHAFRYNMNYLDFSSYTNWTAEFVFPPAVDEHKIYINWFNYLYVIQNGNN